MSIAVWLVVTSLAAMAPAKTAPIPADVKERLARLLPPPAGAAESPRYYSSDLYLYIDGGAEAFHSYDMVAMVHRRYWVHGMEVTVDIYDMGNALNAFGVYSSECSPNQRFLRIGGEANITGSMLNFFQGSFYVKLLAFGENEEPGRVMESLARFIEGQIRTGGAIPAFFSLFPQEHLIPHSQRYVTRAALGHDFLTSAYMASYILEGQTSLLVVADASDMARANQWVEKLRAHFGKSGKAEPWSAMPGAFRTSNQFEGEWLFLARGRYVVILTNPPVRPEAILKTLFAKLPS